MNLNQVALVTGGSQGIGLATVNALAKNGYQVVVIGRSEEHFVSAKKIVPKELINNIDFIRGDVCDETDVKSIFKATIEKHKRLDVLINCAGVSMDSKRSFADTTTNHWNKIIDTNLTGTYLMCREALSHLIKSESGYILNIQSTASYKSQAGTSLYAASKFGVRALTDSLIDEYRNSKLRITSVSPGPVATTIWDHKLSPPSEQEKSKMLRPEDIADIFIWLLSRPAYLHIPDITVTPWN